jgi:hypothetical protein
MNKAEFSGNYKGFRIDVYKDDNGKTFTSAIDDKLELNTWADTIGNSFRYATAWIETKITPQ